MRATYWAAVATCMLLGSVQAQETSTAPQEARTGGVPAALLDRAEAHGWQPVVREGEDAADGVVVLEHVETGQRIKVIDTAPGRAATPADPGAEQVSAGKPPARSYPVQEPPPAWAQVGRRADAPGYEYAVEAPPPLWAQAGPLTVQSPGSADGLGEDVSGRLGSNPPAFGSLGAVGCVPQLAGPADPLLALLVLIAAAAVCLRYGD